MEVTPRGLCLICRAVHMFGTVYVVVGPNTICLILDKNKLVFPDTTMVATSTVVTARYSLQMITMDVPSINIYNRNVLIKDFVDDTDDSKIYFQFDNLFVLIFTDVNMRNIQKI